VVTDGASKWLAHTGYDPDFGARPMRRALQKHIENPLSVQMLAGEFSKGDSIAIDVKDDEIVFEISKAKKAAKKNKDEEVQD
jgi:ATP-dependent Clp protease ATP-binding subunit ClpC